MKKKQKKKTKNENLVLLTCSVSKCKFFPDSISSDMKTYAGILYYYFSLYGIRALPSISKEIMKNNIYCVGSFLLIFISMYCVKGILNKQQDCKRVQ